MAISYKRMKTTPTHGLEHASNDRRSRNVRSDRTRANLLEGARRVVRDRGLEGATSREIAVASGANLQAITYHFGSKDELLAEALFDELERRLAPALRALEVGASAQPVTAMLDAVRALVAGFESSESDAPVYLEALTASMRPGPLRDRSRRLIADVRHRLAEVIEGLCDDGVVPAWIEPDVFAALLVSVANGMVLGAQLEPDAPGVADQAGQFALLLAAVSTPGGAAQPGEAPSRQR